MRQKHACGDGVELPPIKPLNEAEHRRELEEVIVFAGLKDLPLRRILEHGKPGDVRRGYVEMILTGARRVDRAAGNSETLEGVTRILGDALGRGDSEYTGAVAYLAGLGQQGDAGFSDGLRRYRGRV